MCACVLNFWHMIAGKLKGSIAASWCARQEHQEEEGKEQRHHVQKIHFKYKYYYLSLSPSVLGPLSNSSKLPSCDQHAFNTILNSASFKSRSFWSWKKKKKQHITWHTEQWLQKRVTVSYFGGDHLLWSRLSPGTTYSQGPSILWQFFFGQGPFPHSVYIDVTHMIKGTRPSLTIFYTASKNGKAWERGYRYPGLDAWVTYQDTTLLRSENISRTAHCVVSD